MPEHSLVVDFIKHKLGCGCPDEVFQKIDFTDVILLDAFPKSHRVVVGDTLLVYICSSWSVTELNDKLHDIIRLGLKDRDKNRYNRFRLVLNSCDEEWQKNIAKEFNNTVANDEKVHLHFVAPALMKKIIES